MKKLQFIGRFLQVPGEIVIGIIWFIYLLFHAKKALLMKKEDAETAATKLYPFVVAISVLVWGLGIVYIIRK